MSGSRYFESIWSRNRSRVARVSRSSRAIGGIGCRQGREQGIEVDGEDRLAIAPFFEIVDKLVVRDAIYPGREATRRVEALDIFIRLEKDVLYDVRRIIRIEQKLSRITQELRFEARHKRPKRLSIAILHANDYRLIRLLHRQRIPPVYLSR